MTSDPVRTETQKTPFFTTLRRLARQVDSGIKDIQLKLETQPGHGEDSHVASKTLRESKKEMEALKKNARSSLADMRKRNGEFEKMLQLCRDVVDHQLNQLTAIQEYLGQYGYIPSQDTPEKESKVSEMRMSPRLEDFGISSYTLNMMNNRPPPQQSDFKVPSAVPVNNGCKTRHDSVPTPFQTKGLTVTPSLFSSQYRKEATNDGMSPSLSCSPANTVFKPPNRAEAGESAPVPTSPEQPGLAKALDFTDSPVPPVLHTPGMKQIPRMREFMAQSQKGDDQLSSPVPPVFLTPGLKQIPTKAEMTQEAAPGRRVAKQLKLGDDPQAVDSPVPPVLKTPGIKQITKGSSNLASDLAGKESAAFAGRGWTEESEVPKTPELTFSLKVLTVF
ncbi:hypothetical protein BaRGS_00021000 [Batillaria attramentaria]|uniref:Spindle and kinetochore-associated protein 3 n=1 Tax=Batillaria attramentaria TaxID=370345 RepID=A0ABD0KKJ9_9CAEN